MMEDIGLCFGLEAFVPSSSQAAVIPSQSGRSLASSMNCPDSIFLINFPGTGERPSPIVIGCGSWCAVGGGEGDWRVGSVYVGCRPEFTVATCMRKV